MNIYVVRHAEAEHNILDIANDQTSAPVGLTDRGIKQAQDLSVTLGKVNFDAVYTSEMERTIQTARILCPDKQPIKDARLNDIRTGMQGRPFSDFRTALENSEDKWNARFGDGESFEDEKARTVDFLNFLKQKNHQTVLIVTHGGVANIIYGQTHGLSNEDTFSRDIDNASVFRVSI